MLPEAPVHLTARVLPSPVLKNNLYVTCDPWASFAWGTRASILYRASPHLGKVPPQMVHPSVRAGKRKKNSAKPHTPMHCPYTRSDLY